MKSRHAKEISKTRKSNFSLHIERKHWMYWPPLSLSSLCYNNGCMWRDKRLEPAIRKRSYEVTNTTTNSMRSKALNKNYPCSKLSAQISFLLWPSCAYPSHSTGDRIEQARCWWSGGWGVETIDLSACGLFAYPGFDVSRHLAFHTSGALFRQLRMCEVATERVWRQSTSWMTRLTDSPRRRITQWWRHLRNDGVIIHRSRRDLWTEPAFPRSPLITLKFNGAVTYSSEVFLNVISVRDESLTTESGEL